MIPRPNPFMFKIGMTSNMNMGSRIIFMPVPINMAIIETIALPSARIKLFEETTNAKKIVPMNITDMYSLA